MVVDADGRPLPNAQVVLRHVREERGGGPVNLSWQDFNLSASATGRFRFENLLARRYTLEASVEGYRQAVPLAVTVVEGSDLEGLELILEEHEAAVLRGRLDGLSPTELRSVRVTAHLELNGRPPQQLRAGVLRFMHSTPSSEGAWQMTGVAEGEWRIVAEVGQTGRYRERSVQVEFGEVVVDFDFTKRDSTLTVLALRGGRPAPGVRMSVSTRSGYSRGGQADFAGRCVFADLEDRDYTVTVHDQRQHEFLQQEVEVRGDGLIELDLEDAIRMEPR